MDNYEMVTIDKLMAGDTVEHYGVAFTVSRGDFRFDSFMWLTFRGDSYSIGNRMIKRFIFSD